MNKIDIIILLPHNLFIYYHMQSNYLSQLSDELYQEILQYVTIREILHLQQVSKQLKSNETLNKSIYNITGKHNKLNGVNLLVWVPNIRNNAGNIVRQGGYFAYTQNFNLTGLYVCTQKQYRKNNKKSFILDDKEQIMIAHWTETIDSHEGCIIITINQNLEYHIYEFKGVFTVFYAYDLANDDMLLCRKQKYKRLHNVKINNEYRCKDEYLIGNAIKYPIDILHLLRQKIVEK